jgi:protein-export membrane protein SecD
MFLRVFRAVAVLALVGWGAFFVYGNSFGDERTHPFKLGLDLAGGSHLVYEADVSGVDPAEVPELMATLRDVIERRINLFGVSEPIVYVERSSPVAGDPRERLVVELPGVTDIAAAVAEIGRTPLLEFKLIDRERMLANNALGEGDDPAALDPYIDTGLTGRYLESARMEFTGAQQAGQLANEPTVSVRFTREGAELFAAITRANVGEPLAIFLDGELLSAPRINEPILGGTAVISGGFTPNEALELAQNLNLGALPVPIELKSTQIIGATLGAEVVEKGLIAAVIGFSLVLVFMLLWYRLPGLVAGAALLSYIIIMLAIFQLVPVTLTAAGLAGFVLSLGMAVDANVLVFERLKEGLRAGKGSDEAISEGFSRAWSAIRDSNITSLLSAVILFWFGTSMVRGFALVFGIGIIVSMISALFISRSLLSALPRTSANERSLLTVLLGSGLSK